MSGVGALFAALVLPRLQGHLHLDTVVAGGDFTDGLAVAALVVWPTRWAAVPVLFSPARPGSGRRVFHRSLPAR